MRRGLIYWLIWISAIALGFGASLAPLWANPNLVIQIEKAAQPPKIDGIVDEWQALRWIPIAPAALHTVADLSDDGITEAPGTALTAADLSGKFALRWDDQWIYLAAQIYDNVHDIDNGSPETWWLKDAVSLFLDIPLDGDGLSYIPGDHSFSVTVHRFCLSRVAKMAVWFAQRQRVLPVG
jgi:hypothetical protein